MFEKYDSNPPRIISYSKKIEKAHQDSIISFAYLPHTQLLVSASLDKTIKIWNPVSQAFALENDRINACDLNKHNTNELLRKKKTEVT